MYQSPASQSSQDRVLVHEHALATRANAGVAEEPTAPETNSGKFPDLPLDAAVFYGSGNEEAPTEEQIGQIGALGDALEQCHDDEQVNIPRPQERRL